jgi:hypothetical protein
MCDEEEENEVCDENEEEDEDLGRWAVAADFLR